MTSEHKIVGKIDRVVKDYYSYTWTINNLCVCGPCKLWLSPEFTTGSNNENTWFLGLTKSDDFVNACLFRKGTAVNSKEEGQYGLLSVINTEQQKTHERKDKVTFNQVKSNNFECIITDIELLPNKQLTILCEIRGNNVKKANKHRDKRLVNDLENLFEDPKYSDAEIVVGEKTFHVHKAILVSRSSWFKAAFEGGMREQQENKVTVSNYDYEVMQEVLRFIYTGQVKGVENFVDRLLDAAVFYQLDELKTICSDILSDNLSLENAFEVVHLADTHRVIDLKKKALNFISLHTNELVDVEMKCSNVTQKCVIDK